MMEQLADKGNGNNFYIDSLDAGEARVPGAARRRTSRSSRRTSSCRSSSIPAMVARYRLVGYENRDVKDEDFRNDKVDAGEIGAGHQVTALYEVELTAKGKQAHAPLGIGPHPPQAARRRRRRPRRRSRWSVARRRRSRTRRRTSGSRSRSPRSPTCCAAADDAEHGRSTDPRRRARRPAREQDRAELVIADRACASAARADRDRRAQITATPVAATLGGKLSSVHDNDSRDCTRLLARRSGPPRGGFHRCARPCRPCSCVRLCTSPSCSNKSEVMSDMSPRSRRLRHRAAAASAAPDDHVHRGDAGPRRAPLRKTRPP